MKKKNIFINKKKISNSIIFLIIIILFSSYIDFNKTKDNNLKRISVELKIVDPNFSKNFSRESFGIIIGNLISECISNESGKTNFFLKFDTYELTFFSKKNNLCEYHDLKKNEFEKKFSTNLKSALDQYLKDGKNESLLISKPFKIDLISSFNIPQRNLYDPRPILLFVLMIALFYFFLSFNNEKD